MTPQNKPMWGASNITLKQQFKMQMYATYLLVAAMSFMSSVWQNVSIVVDTKDKQINSLHVIFHSLSVV